MRPLGEAPRCEPVASEIPGNLPLRSRALPRLPTQSVVCQTSYERKRWTVYLELRASTKLREGFLRAAPSASSSFCDSSCLEKSLNGLLIQMSEPQSSSCF